MFCPDAVLAVQLSQQTGMAKEHGSGLPIGNPANRSPAEMLIAKRRLDQMYR